MTTEVVESSDTNDNVKEKVIQELGTPSEIKNDPVSVYNDNHSVHVAMYLISYKINVLLALWWRLLFL